MTEIFPIQVRFNDVDQVGHINNVMYGHYCDAARYHFLHTVLGDVMDLMHDNKILIMVHTEFDFVHPSFIDTILNVETRIESIGNRSVHLIHDVIDNKGVIHVHSKAVLSCYDKETDASFPMPQEWRAAIEANM